MNRVMLSVAAAAVGLVLSYPVSERRAEAATPADTLIIADAIDDIVSLDPAQIFEFSGTDLANNVLRHPGRARSREPRPLGARHRRELERRR